MHNQAELLQKKWFYPFQLNDGTILSTYVPSDITSIHATRWQMLNALVKREFKSAAEIEQADVLDIACHQGYFSTQLAKLGFQHVRAVDARARSMSPIPC